jgi:tetratricopeptide (TPR) repeat protein
MKRALCILLWMFSVAAAGQDYTVRIYQAYLAGRMDRWKEVMVDMDRTYSATKNPALLFRLGEAYYGYIAYCIAEGKKNEARVLLEKAEAYVEAYLSIRPDDPKAYSLKGAFYGFRVGLEPLKAPFHGRKSADANEKAIVLGPEEPRAWLEKANIEFYKPAIFGGSKKSAVPLYEKAVRLFEASPQATENNWVYLNSLATLGTAYEETGAIGEADRVYRKLLRLEPSFVWIRDEVYPGFLEKHAPR